MSKFKYKTDLLLKHTDPRAK